MSEVRITLRLPDDVRDQIAAAATENGRSMNAEIVARISNSAPEKTLRDEFASQALIGVVAANNPKNYTEFQLAAIDAYSIADAMVKIRESGNGEG